MDWTPWPPNSPEKARRLFMRSWTNFQLCPENFHPLTGEAGGQRYQSWGPLFALIAVEEYLDFTPWEGFRFGMIKPERKGKLSRVAIQGRHYDVKVSGQSPALEKKEKKSSERTAAPSSAIFSIRKTRSRSR